MRTFAAAVVSSLAALVAGSACHEGEDRDPCVDVECSGHGTCLTDGTSAICDCDVGFRAVGLECVPDSEGDGDADSDSDSDTDGDVDADGDADADADGDVDGDVDGDADGDVDGDADAETDADELGDADAEADADADADAECLLGDFVVVGEVTELSSTANEASPSITEDGLLVVFMSERSGGPGGGDLYVATRATTADPFGTPVLMSVLSTPSLEEAPSISADGLTIYWDSNRAGCVGGRGVWVATRPDRTVAFGAPACLASVSTSAWDLTPDISHDGLELYFSSNRAGSVGEEDLWVASRSSATGPFGTPTRLVSVSSGARELGPSISADGLTLLFHSDRTTSGDLDLYMATRPTTTVAFGAPERLAGVNGAGLDAAGDLSADGLELYFTSSRAGTGGFDIWLARRECL